MINAAQKSAAPSSWLRPNTPAQRSLDSTYEAEDRFSPVEAPPLEKASSTSEPIDSVERAEDAGFVVLHKAAGIGKSTACSLAGALGVAFVGAVVGTSLAGPVIAASLTSAVVSGSLGYLKGKAVVDLASGSSPKIPTWQQSLLAKCGPYFPAAISAWDMAVGVATGVAMGMVPGFGLWGPTTLAFAASYLPSALAAGSLVGAVAASEPDRHTTETPASSPR